MIERFQSLASLVVPPVVLQESKDIDNQKKDNKNGMKEEKKDKDDKNYKDDKKDKDDRKDKDDKEDKKKDKEEKKKRKYVTVNADLLLSCIYFDQNHCGYLLDKDVEEILHSVGLYLSRAQVRVAFLNSQT